MLAALAAVVSLAVVVAGAHARSASMENGLRGFDEVSAVNGSIKSTGARAYRGARSAVASYRGRGANGYARGLFKPTWRSGDKVVYRAAFFLPRGFHRAMQGQVALMRWDNWPSHGGRADQGGIVINGSDRRARLVRGRYDGNQRQIGRPFKLREGRWFRLTVRQRFSKQRPVSRVKVNNRRVVASRQPNFFGRRIERVRFGIVAVHAGAQKKPLKLWFDQAKAKRVR